MGHNPRRNLRGSRRKPDLQRYGATAIEGVGYPIYPIPVGAGGTPSELQAMYLFLGWVAYCNGDYNHDGVYRCADHCAWSGAPSPE